MSFWHGALLIKCRGNFALLLLVTSATSYCFEELSHLVQNRFMYAVCSDMRELVAMLIQTI
jgi:hypothetical protein